MQISEHSVIPLKTEKQNKYNKYINICVGMCMYVYAWKISQSMSNEMVIVVTSSVLNMA